MSIRNRKKQLSDCGELPYNLPKPVFRPTHLYGGLPLKLIDTFGGYTAMCFDKDGELHIHAIEELHEIVNGNFVDYTLPDVYNTDIKRQIG